MFKVTPAHNPGHIIMLGTRAECVEYVWGSYQPQAFAIHEIK